MASESINIIIEAENKASPVLTKVGQDFDALSKHVKESGQKVKAGTELAGTFARAFGGSVFGTFASELAGITEKVSSFSEVSKSGAAGAAVFKTALAAAVGVAAFKIGQVFGEWAFETERWKKQLEESGKAAEKLDQKLAGFAARRAQERKEDVDVARPGAEKEAAAASALAALDAEKRGIEQQIDATKRLVEEGNKRRDAWTADAVWNRGNRQAEAKMNADQLEEQRARRDEIEREMQGYRDLTSERAKALEAKRKENEAKDKSDAFLKNLREEIELLKASKAEQVAIEAARNATPEQQGVAKALIEERDALKAKADEQKKAEQEAEAAAKKEQAAIERIAELEKKRAVDLEARRIELEKGREAAAAYRLEQDGLSKATAERLAAEEEAIRRQEEAAGNAKNLAADDSPTAAVQGRFLTRGTGGDPLLQMGQKQIDVLKQLNADFNRGVEKIYEAGKKRDPYTLKTVTVP